jgi:Branched-chain amino acid aminotransferase/4-amino-4-deoxychorismate lyase
MILVNDKKLENMNENSILVLDDGFQFGKGVFETIYVQKGPVFLEKHLERINKAIKDLNIGKSIERSYIEDIIKYHKIIDCVFKIIVTPKNIVITTRTNSYKQEQYNNGFKIKLSSIKRNPYSHFTYYKTTNYLDNILEKEIATKEGYNEVIFLNTENTLAEGSTCNIFFIKNHNLYTPGVDCGILNGIVRDWIISNYEVHEGYYDFQDLLDSDGVFLTNCIMGMMPVSFVGNMMINRDVMINEIRSEYEAFINKFQLKDEPSGYFEIH